MESINIHDHVSFDERKPVFRTLLPGPGPRVALLCLNAGQTLPEHTTNDAITVQALSGRVVFTDGPTPFDLTSGMLIRLPAGRPHSVSAVENSVLLVTIFGLAAEAVKSPATAESA